MAEQNNGQQVQDTNALIQVRKDKLKDLVERGKNPFEITKFDVTNHSQEIKDNFATLDGQTVTVAGRMMSKRVMGKASFCHVQDLQGHNWMLFLFWLHPFILSGVISPLISSSILGTY